ncbi:MAG: multidrug ABC transporter permease [Deltaproteobacteria bacterium]|nr:MAG: multidrug ABC transporter permease [Deltaproteobacteria bacterium]
MTGKESHTGPITLLGKELRLLVYDRWLLCILTILPLGLSLFVAILFQEGIVRNLPVAAVDLDHSQLSRSLIRGYDASSQLHIQTYPCVAEATSALRKGKVYAVAIVPSSLEKDLRRGLSPRVTVFYNYQSLLVGRVLKSALFSAHATFNAGLKTLEGLFRGNIQLAQAQASAVVTRRQITPLYNVGFNYTQFLVTGLIPTIWQIIIVATMVLVWAAEERRTGVSRWLSRSAFAKVVVRFVFYQGIFLLYGMFFLVFFVQKGWPMRGSLPELLVAQWLTIFACQLIATLFYLCIPDAPRALSLAAAYTAPSFAFLGITFPTTDMNLFPQLWRSLLPISHYMEIQVGMMNYGLKTGALLPSFKGLFAFWAVIVPVFVLVVIRKKVAAHRD